MQNANQTGQAQCQDQDLLAIIDDLNYNIEGLKQHIATIESPLYDKYHATLLAQYDEQMSLMKYNAGLYDWEQRASDVMMWIVVAVVAAGVVFSGFQLYMAARLGQKADGTFEVSATGMKVTSTIIGVLILAMSIAFMLIFVDKVYTIQTQIPPASISYPAAQGGH